MKWVKVKWLNRVLENARSVVATMRLKRLKEIRQSDKLSRLAGLRLFGRSFKDAYKFMTARMPNNGIYSTLLIGE